jgi:hypothetical protein
MFHHIVIGCEQVKINWRLGLPSGGASVIMDFFFEVLYVNPLNPDLHLNNIVTCL